MLAGTRNWLVGCQCQVLLVSFQCARRARVLDCTLLIAEIIVFIYYIAILRGNKYIFKK